MGECTSPSFSAHMKLLIRRVTVKTSLFSQENTNSHLSETNTAQCYAIPPDTREADTVSLERAKL